MANKTIDFDEIYAGQKGSEVSQIILENLKKLSARIIELEDKISQIKGSSIDGATVIDNTGSISVQYAPTSVFGKTYPTSQVSYVSVKVTYGTSDLYPGSDDSSLHYSYSLTNSDIMSNGKKIGTVEPVVEYSNLKFKVIISPNTISDSNFSFTITFKGKTYSYTVPIIIMNDNHALNGQSVYTSTVFKRSTIGTPSTPTGGSFDNPIPSGWSDGITGGSGDLYTSHRTFTSDGQPPQSAEWSIPMLAQDSADIDFCYSAYTVGRPKSPSELGLPHGSQDSDTSIYQWHDSGTENDVWMAISVKSGNEWGDWSVLKIKGENGNNGDWMDYVFKQHSGDTLSPPTTNDPTHFDKVDDPEDVNFGWLDGPGVGSDWWMSCALIDGTTGKLKGDNWSKPKRLQGEKGADGSYTELKYKVSDNMLTHPFSSATWYDNVLDAYHEIDNKYDYLLPNYYMWIRQRRYDGTTKLWGEYEYMRVTGEKGETGTGLEIQGSMPSYHDLFALSDPEDGTCYIVFGHVWSWVASSTEIIYDNLSVKEKEEYQAKYGTTLSQRHWRDGGQIQGPQGISGETAYLHIKFANTARYVSGNTYQVDNIEWLTTFEKTNDGEAPGRFIGMYTDSNQMDSSEPSKYIWTKYTGDDGLNYEYIYTRTATDTDVPVPKVPQEMVNGTDTTPVNVVKSINPEGVIKTTTKAYQENDWVPYTGTIVNEVQITKYDWTDNPMGPTEKLPFEWCCKREKSISISGSTALWGAFYGKANNTTNAFLFNKYGDSALQIDMTNQIHGYKRNAYGNCIIETVVCKINASKDGKQREITSIIVSGDTSQFTSTTSNESDKTVTLINKPNMTSGGILTFKITIDGEIYDKTFNYTVTDDGTPGLTIYFDPESIVAEEDIVSGVVSTENTYAHLNVYQDGKQLKYSSGNTLASNEYSVSITDESFANIRQKIDFTGISDNGRYKFHITNFDVRGTKPYGGTVEFNIVTGGITYKRALKWMVNWLGFFRQTICGDTMTNIAQSVNSAIDDMGLLTTTSANSMFVQSSTGIVEQVSKLSGDVDSLSGTTGSLQLSANSFTTKIEDTNGRCSRIEQNIDNLSFKVGEMAVRQNLLPNSRFNLRTNYYWFSTRKIILSPGQYTLSGRGRVDTSGCYLRLVAYLNDNNWDNAISFNSESFVIKETTFNVTNENTICDLGVYFNDNYMQYRAPLGKFGYIDWVKIENGSGATEYCQSIYDTGVNNILNLTPYEVSDFNTSLISNGTKTKCTSNDGNYVTISNTSGKDWQLRWFNEKHYNESLVLNGGPRTTYYWMVVRRKSPGSNDNISFGVQNRSTGYGTSHFNTSIIINSKTSKYFTLNNGWVMYYASANLMNSAFKQKNLLEISASYKVTITTPQPTQTQTKLVFEEGTFTYTFPSGSTAEEVAKIIEKNGADGYNTTRNGSIVYFINKTKMKHSSSAHADGASTTMEKYKGKWDYDASSGVEASGGVLTYSTKNAPTGKNIVLGECIIDDNLNPGQIYTLSFVGKNTGQSSGVPLTSYVYSVDTNPLGSLNNQFTPYVETSESGVNGATSISYVENTADCRYSWNLTSDFKEYSYSFKVSSTYDNTQVARVLFRLNHVNGGSYGVIIKQIKLEQGGGKTGYDSRPGYLNTAPTQYIGINSIIGTWDVLDCGISYDGVPSVASINSTLLAAKQRGELLDTGIDIENRHVTITSDNFTVQNNEGNQTFLIDEFGKVNVNVLNADSILTNALSAKTINANSATFTNLKIAGESSFGGLVKKIKTTITKDNILNYANKDFTEGSKLKIWSLEKLGTWIEIQSVPDNYILLFELPSISAYDVNGNPYDSDKLNYARSMVGNTLIITNKTSRPLNVRSYISTGIGEPGDTVNYIDSGYTMSLTCKMRPFPNKDNTYSHLFGYEEIYWEGVTMKTSPEKETT